MSVFEKSLPIVLQSLMFNYQYITLAVAVLFVIADAIAIFACLRRAESGTKWVSFWAPMTVYIALSSVILCNLQKFVNVILGVKVGIPPICGFIAAIVCGMLFTGFSVLFCGSCVMKIGGRLALCLSTLAMASAEAFVLFKVYLTADGHEDADLSIGSVLKGIINLPDSISKIHIDYIALLLLIIFFIALFLCFISNKNRYQIAEGEKNVRAEALARQYGVTGDKAKSRFCCKYCQYATELANHTDCMLCENRGVVDINHICNDYVYDPLKKEPDKTDSPLSKLKKKSADKTEEIQSDEKSIESSKEAAIIDSLRKRNR